MTKAPLIALIHTHLMKGQEQASRCRTHPHLIIRHLQTTTTAPFDIMISDIAVIEDLKVLTQECAKFFRLKQNYLLPKRPSD